MTNVVVDGLRARGVTLDPLYQEGKLVRLTWDSSEPILGTRAMVVIPDMHFAAGDGGDVFAFGSTPTPLARLGSLVDGLVGFKTSYEASGRRLSVLQLGDLYDVWRAYPEYVDHPTSDYGVIESAYGGVIGNLMDACDARVCVGNHDATMANYPPSWARNANGPNGRLAYAQAFVSGKILGFHGHQVDQMVEAMGSQSGEAAARVATILAKLSSSLSQLIQQNVDFAIDFFADPSPQQLVDVALRQWPSSTSLTDTSVFQSPRWCDREHPEHLRALIEGISGASMVRIAFVGHSHRPGVTGVTVGSRFVPVIDVGSWVWGASQIAIAVEGEVSLWTVS
ncbi:hypothetical protein BH09MYX1_BH09MYX1_42240 [soil metagenome]